MNLGMVGTVGEQIGQGVPVLDENVGGRGVVGEY